MRPNNVPVRRIMTNASNLFYKLSGELSRFGNLGNAELKTSVQAAASEIGVNRARYILLLVGQIEDAIDLLGHVSLPAERIDKSRNLLRGVQEKMHGAFGQRNGTDFLNALGGAHIIDTIEFIGDTVESLRLEPGGAIDRDMLTRQTEDLLSALQGAGLPHYATRVLQLKLMSVHRVLAESQIYSDGDLRRRVKSVFADYCAEFNRFDDQFSTFSEKMYRWAKTAGGVGVFALALTADASSIAGLLPPPSAG